MPLIDLDKKVSLEIELTDSNFEQATLKIYNFVEWGFEEEPNQILENFKKYQFLMERNVV